MRTLRLALAQINPTVGDLEGNFQKIVDLISEKCSFKYLPMIFVITVQQFDQKIT